jgi:hypothetical protein
MNLLKALPELISAGLLFWLWSDPMHFGLDWFKSGVLTLMLEFFVIHASGFMAVLMYDPDTPRGKRALQVGGLGAFYLLFISAFAWGFDAWWMLLAFTWLCFGKLQALWTGAPPVEKDRFVAIAAWALSVAVFLGSVAATAILEVPRLGVTDAVRDGAGFSGASSGLWEAEPWRALAGAVLYFAIMGLSRPLFARWHSGA